MSKTNNNLETQTPFLWIIFGRENSPLKKEFKVYYEKLTAWCEINAKMWCFIGHDKDTQEDGSLKFRHIHALIILKDGTKPRLSTSLGRLAEVVDIPRQDVDIEHAENVASCVRYCLHKGYPDKYPYPVEELQTNLTADELKPYLEIDNKSFTAHYLIKLVEICGRNRLTIMKQIGLANYCRYRNCINDIIECLLKE